MSAKRLEKLEVRDWFCKGVRTTKSLVKTLHPLMLHLHQYRKRTDKKAALDVLEIKGGRYDRQQADKVKDTLRTMLGG